jgi:calcineurin-like phosphoesterase family protein
MSTFYTSDLHFCHRNIIEYCNRPFRHADGQPDVQRMNRALIDNWNARVGQQDLTYLIGDFGMGPWQEWARIRRQLNGRIVLVKGNHDKKTSSWLLAVDEVHASLWVDGIYMIHIPPQEPAVIPDNTRLILCGHVHEKWKESSYRGIRMVNVGVDVWDMKPVTLEEIDGEKK